MTAGELAGRGFALSQAPRSHRSTPLHTGSAPLLLSAALEQNYLRCPPFSIKSNLHRTSRITADSSQNVSAVLCALWTSKHRLRSYSVVQSTAKPPTALKAVPQMQQE